jgi:thiol-disulfide isomerase/thioredoxin
MSLRRIQPAFRLGQILARHPARTRKIHGFDPMNRHPNFKVLIPLLVALLGAAGPARAVVPPGWSTNLHDALAAARTNQKPVVLYFTAEWCGPCRVMGASTLRETNVLRRLEDFSLVALDLDLHGDLAARHQVSAIPTFLILAPDGDGTEAARHTGFIDAKPFAEWLSRGTAAVERLGEENRKFAERERAINAALASPDPTAAIADLLELCADPHPTRRAFALGRLKGIARDNPGRLIPGLAHPKLATRIATANTLRDTLGAGFEFDPWATAPEREKSIAAARQRLSAPAR